jgi:hypothetical protein
MERGVVNVDAPWNLVRNRFQASLDTAEEMLARLMGDENETGYLGEIQEAISNFTPLAIAVNALEIPDTSSEFANRPVPDLSGLDNDFPSFNEDAPSLLPIPTVDMSVVTTPGTVQPGQIDVVWSEIPNPEEVYAVISSYLISALGDGITGLDPAVEQEIFDRARARLLTEHDKQQRQLEEYFSVNGFPMPTGAMAGRLQELSSTQSLEIADLNGKVMVEQAELAQKNTQFVITVMKDIDSVLRDFTVKRNMTTLDFAKSRASSAVSLYAEQVKAVLTTLEAEKLLVEVQVENLKAVVEYNKGMIDSFTAEITAKSAITDAKAKKNTAIVDVFKADVDGFKAETEALTSEQNAILNEYKLRLEHARLDLDAQIAMANNALQGYGAESSLSEKVSSSMANIAAQVVASAYGSVNASAGLSYNGSESVGETYGHSETRGNSATWSEDVNYSQALHESHPFEPEAA